jgi:hypothetical protein
LPSVYTQHSNRREDYSQYPDVTRVRHTSQNGHRPNKWRYTQSTLAYALETSTLTKRDRKQLNIFERKVYRGILGPVYDKEKEN